MPSQKGFANILVGFIVVGVIIVGIFIVNSKRAHQNQNSQVQNPSVQTSNSPIAAKKNNCLVGSVMVEVSRESAEKAFTNALTDIKMIDHISPGSQVGDKRFTYLWIKSNQKVPVFAPADGTLIKISYKTRVDVGPGMSSPDYDLTFLVDCHTMYRINHITDPNPEIAALKPNAEPLQLGKGLAAPSEQDTKPSKNIMVKAGDQIGTTTGTPAAHNWDFGVFIDQTSTCPYEKYSEPLRTNWLALFKGVACEVNGNL